MTVTRDRVFRAGGVTRDIPLAAAAPVTYVADISEYQPDITDAAYLAWSKAIVIRAMYGDAQDDAAWYGGARRADLHKGGAVFVGIYQYLLASQDGGAQAKAFHGLVGAIEPGEVFIADIEQGDHALLTAWYNEMIALYGAGIGPYLWTYTGLAFGESAGLLPVQWIADYASAEPSTPHKLWQFTDSYQVPGVGTADCSLFHGTAGELAALAYPVPVPVPPADWTFGPVRALKVEGAGPHSVKLTWEAPAARMPEPVGRYVVSVEHAGKVIASYPRDVSGSGSETWQGGSLEPSTSYTALVRAETSAGTHAGTQASVSFTTAAA